MSNPQPRPERLTLLVHLVLDRLEEMDQQLQELVSASRQKSAGYVLKQATSTGEGITTSLPIHLPDPALPGPQPDLPAGFPFC